MCYAWDRWLKCFPCVTCGKFCYYPYVGWPRKKMAATLKVRKWYARNVDVRLVKGFHEHDQALSGASMSNGTVRWAGEHRWSTRPASSYPKTGKSSIFWISFCFCQNCQPGYYDKGWSYYNDSIAKKNVINQRILHSPPIRRKKNSDWSANSRTTMCLYACLYTPFFWIIQLRHRPEASKHV